MLSHNVLMCGVLCFSKFIIHNHNNCFNISICNMGSSSLVQKDRARGKEKIELKYTTHHSFKGDDSPARGGSGGDIQ